MTEYQTVAQQNLACAIRIRERRKELGLTQAEVVDRVDRYGSRLSNQALSAIENGRRLAVGRLPDLAAALECTVTLPDGSHRGPAPLGTRQTSRAGQATPRRRASHRHRSRAARRARPGHTRPAAAGSSDPTCRISRGSCGSRATGRRARPRHQFPVNPRRPSCGSPGRSRLAVSLLATAALGVAACGSSSPPSAVTGRRTDSLPPQPHAVHLGHPEHRDRGAERFRPGGPRRQGQRVPRDHRPAQRPHRRRPALRRPARRRDLGHRSAVDGVIRPAAACSGPGRCPAWPACRPRTRRRTSGGPASSTWSSWPTRA